MSDLAGRLVKAAAGAVSLSYLPDLLMPPDEFTAECKVAAVAVLRCQVDELDVWLDRIKSTVTDRKMAAAQQLGLRLCRLRLIETIDALENTDA